MDIAKLKSRKLCNECQHCSPDCWAYGGAKVVIKTKLELLKPSEFTHKRHRLKEKLITLSCVSSERYEFQPVNYVLSDRMMLSLIDSVMAKEVL